VSAAIETHRLTKRCGTARGSEALARTVETGEVLGFLGANGSGKSTTIRALLDERRVPSHRWSKDPTNANARRSEDGMGVRCGSGHRSAIVEGHAPPSEEMRWTVSGLATNDRGSHELSPAFSRSWSGRGIVTDRPGTWCGCTEISSPLMPEEHR
jgi:ABC-type transport system involved in cytochrome c biogenesis ATPase subunit